MLLTQLRKGFVYFLEYCRSFCQPFLCTRISSRLHKLHCTHHHTLTIHAILWHHGFLSCCEHTSASLTLQLIQVNSHASHQPTSSTRVPTGTCVANCVTLRHASGLYVHTCDVSHIAALQRARVTDSPHSLPQPARVIFPHLTAGSYFVFLLTAFGPECLLLLLAWLLQSLMLRYTVCWLCT